MLSEGFRVGLTVPLLWLESAVGRGAVSGTNGGAFSLLLRFKQKLSQVKTIQPIKRAQVASICRV